MSIPVWADLVRTTHPLDPKHETTINILQALLEDRIDPTNAAHSIASTYESYLKYEIQKTSDYYKLGTFWSIFGATTRQFGGAKGEVLADFLIALHTLPPVRDDAGRPVQHQGGGMYWTDLPEFGAMFRDYGNFVDHEDDDDCDDVGGRWLEQAHAYCNATEFLATLFVRSCRDMGGTFHASGAMQDALENDEIPPRQKMVAMFLPAAAAWMMIGGEQLYHHCRGRSGAASAATGVLWKGGHALSPERWSFWRGRFETLSEAGIGKKYREMAASAAGRMKEIEGRVP